MIKSFKCKETKRIFEERFSRKLPQDIQRLAARKLIMLNFALTKICSGKSGISADTALRLARYFGNSVEFWTGIQSHYDTECAKLALGDRLEKEVKVLKRVA